ncbi:MAG: DEAD/DEAH box helicase [Treponema sp.]|nr:DEAD/DEAH box helicase [Treponema sp.]
MNFENPLIVQGNRTLLLDVHAPRAEECRNALIPFAELESSPEHLHTYKLTPLSLWNYAGAGFSPEDAVKTLKEFSRYDVPQSIEAWIFETASRFGKIRLVPGETVTQKDDSGKEFEIDYLYLVCESPLIWKQIAASTVGRKMLVPTKYENNNAFLVNLVDRGTVKQELLKLGWPVKDEVPLEDGEPLEINLRTITRSGFPFAPRTYQIESANALIGNKGAGTGFGTIVLPCGAGKTIVGMTIMSMLKTSTLVITTNISAVHQWISELLDKTELTEDQISEYTGENKDIKPVTVATYQVLTWRPDKEGPYPHFSLFRKRNWGLIIYDEVHMLPAPVFRVTAEIQAIRRVGLTATLVREDGQEGNVFSLVGPKRYDVPWKELETSGFIASAECIEIRLDLSESSEIEYAVAEQRKKHRLASENPRKLEIVEELVKRNPEDKILVIGQYIAQLSEIAQRLSAPIITGKTPNAERDEIYGKFRSGEIRVLVVSKVANFAIDLPDASMAIQVSGTFGSRQEEAQRLGRILRPKERMSRFFTLITRNSVEEDFGSNRQKFLAEQGYAYRIIRFSTISDLDEINGAVRLEQGRSTQ